MFITDGRKPTYHSLLRSIVSVIVCFSMLLGTTWAWFTDKATSSGNKIVSGSLNVDLLHLVGGDWISLKEEPNHKVIDYDLWEPGYTQVETLKIKNNGNLALSYRLNARIEENTEILGTNGESLADVIDVYMIEGASTATNFAAVSSNWKKLGSLKNVMNSGNGFTYGYMLPAGATDAVEGEDVGERVVSYALHMREEAGNAYQNLSLGNVYFTLLASQYAYENDSFGKDYDWDAVMDLLADVEVSAMTSNTEDVTITTMDGKASILIPAGALGEQKVTFSITEGTLGSYTIEANATDETGVGVGSTTVQTTTYDIKLKDEEGNVLSTTAEKPFTIMMYVGKGFGAVPVYHEGALISGTTYNNSTGYVTFKTTSFSDYEFDGVKFTYSGEYFDFSQSSVTIYNVSEISGLSDNPNYKPTYADDGTTLTDSVLTLPDVGNYILYSTTKTFGQYTPLSVEVPEGSRVLLYNVALAPLNRRDAITIVKSSATNTAARTTYILLADGTNNHLDGRYNEGRPVTGTSYGATMGTNGSAGIGISSQYGNNTYAGELVISGPQGAIYADGGHSCAGIGSCRWGGGAFNITLKDIRFAHAYGGDNAAGVGGSQGISNSWGYVGNIVVDLGDGNCMVAKSGGNAPAVGAGGNGDCKDIYFLSGHTACWIGHYASYTSAGRCTWSSQCGDIYFIGGTVSNPIFDASDGNGANTIYFNAADKAEAEAKFFGGSTMKIVKGNVEYGYTMQAEQPFLYRIGNQNSITIEQLTQLLTGTKKASATISVEKVDNNHNVSYANNQFSGTGVVKITVDGVDYFAEIVNAKNTTTGDIRNSGLGSGTNFVFLNDVEYTGEKQTINMDGSTIYGNGFKWDFSGWTPQNSELGNGFVISMKNGTLDNVRMIGKTYTDGAYVYKSDASGKPENYMSLVVATGDSKILNSYVSGTRSPVRVEGNLTISNSTIAGGNVANIDVKSGTLNLNNVTTINQGTNPVGYGIFIDNDSTNVTINVNGLNSYNWLTIADKANMNDTTSNKYMPTILQNIFNDSNFSGVTAINFGIICLNNSSGVTVTGTNALARKEATISGGTGVLWYATGDSVASAPDYEPNTYDPVPPTFEITNINTTEPEENATTYTWYDGTNINVGIQTNGSQTIDFSEIVIAKAIEVLPIKSVSVSGGTATVSGTKVTFASTGEFVVTIAVDDNKAYDRQGNVIEVETSTHTYEIPVIVEITTIPNAVLSSTVTTQKFGYSTSSDWYYIFQLLPDGLSVNDKGETITFNSGTGSTSGNKLDTANWDYAIDSTGYIITLTHKTKTTITGDKQKLVITLGQNQASSNNWTTEQNINFGFIAKSTNATSKKSSPYSWSLTCSYVYYGYSGSASNTLSINFEADSSSKVVEGKSSGCFASGTMITLADGTQKAIEDVTMDDTLLAFDHESGKFVASPILFIEYDGESEYQILNLEFSNGAHLRYIYEHGLFDLTLNKYVYITEDTISDYIGHEFSTGDGTSLDSTTLVKSYITYEQTGCYSLVTAYQLNYYTDGFLSMPGGITGLFNYFDFGEDLKYDEEQMQRDIETYGLLTYEDLADLVSEEAFEVYNGKYLLVSMGKGLMSYEDIMRLAERYGCYV